MRLSLFIIITLLSTQLFSQPVAPTIIEVKQNEHVATIYWNSKTDNYSKLYDPWKNQGSYSYIIEWGKVSEGFTNKSKTPYRVIQCQPLIPGEIYQAKVFALDAYGVKSAASDIIQFQHSSIKADAMRNRLNGFFDDFNLVMGPYDELKWNQSYSGCAKIGYLSQHINNQFHAHNVVASDGCDRGIASSRCRETFDFTNRTGIIEFDLDGSKQSRQRWYLDLSPASRKRDLTGHVAIDDTPQGPKADPAFLLRIAEIDNRVLVHIANDEGVIVSLNEINNMYQNGACGLLMEYCNGENLNPIPNVRKHWKIELSKDHLKIFINDILVVDGSLITAFTPNGLPYEIAQVNWLYFSYNTTKENIPISMVHWDNFGFDAPTAYAPTNIIHNYTDGKLGTETEQVGNDPANGMTSTNTVFSQSIIPIPDQIMDTNGNLPSKAELMFTLQGGDYSWNDNDSIKINGSMYCFEQPNTLVPNLTQSELISTIKPHSAILEINPADLIIGNNLIDFYLNEPRLLNIHLELTYPISSAPSFTQPIQIHSNYFNKLMEFNNYNKLGANHIIDKMDGFEIWLNEFQIAYNNTDNYRTLVKQTPISGMLNFDLIANSNNQLTAKGVATGFSHYEVWIDQKIIQTVYVNANEPSSYFHHFDVAFNTALLDNGIHELYVVVYDINGKTSVLDLFETHVKHGEYLPIVFTSNNPIKENCANNLNDLDLGGGLNNYIQMQTYFASNNITTTGKIQFAKTITFKAANEILLNNGFEVEIGGSFIAEIDDCF